MVNYYPHNYDPDCQCNVCQEIFQSQMATEIYYDSIEDPLDLFDNNEEDHDSHYWDWRLKQEREAGTFDDLPF